MRVLVGLSGGVDSSQVIALLRDRGDQVVAATLIMQHEPCPVPPVPSLERARRTCELLGVPLVEQDISACFATSVRDAFVSGYAQGHTPSPCVTCNRDVKFASLARLAREHGCDEVATGHYVRKVRSQDGRWRLARAADPVRDQSYFLCLLPQDVIDLTEFPLADLTKDQTRALADERHLPAAHVHDSQGVCFAPEGDYRSLIHELEPGCFTPGAIVDEGGAVLGTHEGTVGYTIGQRKGLGLSGGPYFVRAIDPVSATITVGRGATQGSSTLALTDVNLTCTLERANELGVVAQTHFHATPVAVELDETDDGTLLVRTAGAEGVLAVPGQVCALYHEDVLLGGGIISVASE